MSLITASARPRQRFVRRLVVLLLVGLGAAGLLWPHPATAARGLSAEELPLERTTNILLLGSDRYEGVPNWRTDVMMILALDLEHGQAGVISIPRDLFLDEIPGHQPNRINVVDYLGEQDSPGGGPELMSQLLAEHMGVRIDHYIRFDFESFRQVVDALDGVEIEVDCPFVGYLRDEGGWLRLDPGAHRLAGNQALIYVRDREYNPGDLDRARRQQRFVWAVRNQVMSDNLLPKLPALYSALAGSVDTDIGLVKAIRLARFALRLAPEDLHGMVIAPPDLLVADWRLGMSVFVPDWEAIAGSVQQIFDAPPFADANTPDDCKE